MKATSSCILLLLLLLLHYSNASAIIFENNTNQTSSINSDNNGQVDAQDSANVDELIGNGIQNLADNKEFIKIIRNLLNEFLSQCQSGNFNRTTQKLLRDDCAAGTYSDASSDHKCVKCPNGTFSEAGATVCQACDGVVTQNQSGCYVKPELRLDRCFTRSRRNHYIVDFTSNCSAAIDGNTNDVSGKASCVTLDIYYKWVAHFNGLAAVHYVTVYSSMESHNTNQRIKFSIEIDGKPCAFYDGGPFTATTLRCNATGSSVIIRNRYGGKLSLCEVKVFGDKTSAHQLKLERCMSGGERAFDGDTSSFIMMVFRMGVYNWYAFTENTATISNVVVYSYIFSRNIIVVKVDGKQCSCECDVTNRTGEKFIIHSYQCNTVGSKVEIRSFGDDRALVLYEVTAFGNYVY